jgi:1,4-dihydroxy-6-naphthoate synthase
MGVTTPTQTQAVRIGHTPDMDDAFMFYAMAKNLVPLGGLKIEHVIEDIQALNQRSARAELDVTAISAAAYPSVSDRYAMLSVGSSVGRNYGPLVISTTPRRVMDLIGRPVAIPGLHTTASLLLQLAAPGCVPVEMEFSQVPNAVLSGKVDAGLVIHEWQLTYRDADLIPVIDLGMWWQEQTRLPIPLGLNVVKKSLGQPFAERIATLLFQSIQYGLAHIDDAMAYAMQYGRGTDVVRSKQFVGMYVNEDTLYFPEPCREALRQLYARAFDAKLIAQVPVLDIIEPDVR